MKNLLILFILFFCLAFNCVEKESDPYLWLEQIDDSKALQWVSEISDKTKKTLEASPHFQDLYKENLAIYDSEEKIAYPRIVGNHVYNFWKDKQYQRGVWRRSRIENYLKGKPKWEILLNMDEWQKKDAIPWVFKGYIPLAPDYKRFIVSVSKGGSDASIRKEYDVEKKAFTGRFEIPQAKSRVSWKDQNTLYIATDFGKGSLTDSGYPRVLKEWKIGTPLENARTIFEGNKSDVSVMAFTDITPEKTYAVALQWTSFYTQKYYAIENNDLIPIDIPEDAQFVGLFKKQVIIQLKSDWILSNNTFKQGEIISIPYLDLIKGKQNYVSILLPDRQSAIRGVSITKNNFIVNLLVNVKSQLLAFKYQKGKWVKRKLKTPQGGTLRVRSADTHSDRFFYTYTNFLNPTTLYFYDFKSNKNKAIRTLPHFFDAKKYQVKQYKAISKDGTAIPYFMVASKSVKLDGKNPTLISAYGGFEIARLPNYIPIVGSAWLKRGGVFVLANLRGGGEYGPRWHQAGLKEKRQNIYDDLFAVSEDLIAKKITAPQFLGVEGRSNGGLLVGVAFTQRPDLYNAIVCGVPLLDMKRYNKLLAGASWMAEYGNPDIQEQWEYIKKYSPYHNLKADKKYPNIFFYTSTRDDRVHPGHARKMAAKMMDMGHPILYYENTEGGHAGTSTNKQLAYNWAMIYSYLLNELKAQ